MVERLPTQFGKYQLVERLACGGMAEVFLALLRGDRGFEKTLVIKRILPLYGKDPLFIEMFTDEAVLAARLTHPNVVQIYDFGAVDDIYFIAMEYVEGLNIRALLHALKERSRRLTFAETAAIGEGICRGLSYAHAVIDGKGIPLGLVHRDINPQNVMISRAGEPKVMDFGIAKAKARVSRTKPGSVKGTYAYMSPEQVLGLAVDKRTDQFSLGVILWECLTGERLFEGDTDLTLVYKIVNARIPLLADVRPDVPAELARIVSRALARQPEDRYPDLREMAHDLADFRFSMGPAGVARLSDLVEELMPAAISIGSHDFAATVPTQTPTPPSSPELPRTQPLDAPVGRADAKTVPLASSSLVQDDGVDLGAATAPARAAAERGGRVDRQNTQVLPAAPTPAADSPAPAEPFDDTQVSPAPPMKRSRRSKIALYSAFGSAAAVATIAGVLYRPAAPVAPTVVGARTTAVVASTVAASAPTMSVGALTQRFPDRLAMLRGDGVAPDAAGSGRRGVTVAAPRAPPVKAAGAGKTRPSPTTVTKAPASSESPSDPAPSAPPRPDPAADGDPEVVYIEAVKLIKTDDIEGAIETLNRCVQIDPRYGECFRALGIAYARVGNKPRAARYYKKYLQVMPDAADAEKVKEILAQFERVQ